MKDYIKEIHRAPFLGKVFPTLNSCLKQEISSCKSVLDIGCGPSSPLQYCEGVEISVGVEPYKPYLDKSEKKTIHNEYYGKKIEKLAFKENEFDAVIMLELIEHLPKEAGFELLERAEKWAREKIIVSTPNGFLPQGASDDNPLQKHLSGWSLEELRNLGFSCRGLAGLKFLRTENQENSMEEGSLCSSIKFKPHLFWFGVATLSQALTYYFPNFAFEFFCVKEL